MRPINDVVSRVEAGPSSTQQVPPSPLPTHSWRRPSLLPLLHSPQSLHKSCLIDRKPTCELFYVAIDIASGVAGPPPRLDPGQVSSLPPRSTQTRAQGPLPRARTQSLHNHYARRQSGVPGTSDKLLTASYNQYAAKANDLSKPLIS